MIRVTDPADPRRCKHSFPHEQCWNVACEGYDYCAVHGGRDNSVADDARAYQLNDARYRINLAAKSSNPEHLKSLTEEIALARILVEGRMNLIKSDADLIAHSSPINTLLLTIERLVKSCHQIEQSFGVLLAKPTVLKLGQDMCEIVVQELQGIDNYEEIVDRITDRLIATIAKATNAE